MHRSGEICHRRATVSLQRKITLTSAIGLKANFFFRNNSVCNICNRTIKVKTKQIKGSKIK